MIQCTLLQCCTDACRENLLVKLGKIDSLNHTITALLSNLIVRVNNINKNNINNSSNSNANDDDNNHKKNRLHR